MLDKGESLRDYSWWWDTCSLHLELCGYFVVSFLLFIVTICIQPRHLYEADSSKKIEILKLGTYCFTEHNQRNNCQNECWYYKTTDAGTSFFFFLDLFLHDQCYSKCLLNLWYSHVANNFTTLECCKLSIDRKWLFCSIT